MEPQSRQDIPCGGDAISAELPLPATRGAQLIVAVAKGPASSPGSTILAWLESICSSSAMSNKRRSEAYMCHPVMCSQCNPEAQCWYLADVW